MIARVELKDTKTNMILWDNPSLVFRREYDATGSQTDTELGESAAYFGQDAKALDRITTEFANTIVLHPGGFLPTLSPPTSARKSPQATWIPSTCCKAKTTSERRRSRSEFAALVEEGLRGVQRRTIYAGDVTTGDRIAEGVRARWSPPYAPCR